MQPEPQDSLSRPLPPPATPPCPAPVNHETRAEELANTLTHAVGAAFAIIGLVVLVLLAVERADPYRIIGFSIYGATLVLLYLASTCYHGCRNQRLKNHLLRFDYAAIYLLIAGTYTPFMLITLRGPWGWGLLTAVWTMAIFGILIKSIVMDRFVLLSTFLYLLMGWIGMVAARPLFDGLSLGGTIWLLAGGAAYTAGVIFFLWERLPFNHAIWHLFVLAGSVCHFFAVLLYVLPAQT
jgi:hemolysin III